MEEERPELVERWAQAERSRQQHAADKEAEAVKVAAATKARDAYNKEARRLGGIRNTRSEKRGSIVSRSAAGVAKSVGAGILKGIKELRRRAVVEGNIAKRNENARIVAINRQRQAAAKRKPKQRPVARRQIKKPVTRRPIRKQQVDQIQKEIEHTTTPAFYNRDAEISNPYGLKSKHRLNFGQNVFSEKDPRNKKITWRVD